MIISFAFALQELFPYRVKMLVSEVCPFSNQIFVINEVNILNILKCLSIKFSLMHIANQNIFLMEKMQISQNLRLILIC